MQRSKECSGGDSEPAWNEWKCRKKKESAAAPLSLVCKATENKRITADVQEMKRGSRVKLQLERKQILSGFSNRASVWGAAVRIQHRTLHASVSLRGRAHILHA